MSIGQEVTPAGVSELPAIVVPPAAPSQTARQSRRRTLKSTLAVLGAVGLTTAVLAPTGVALAGPVATVIEPAQGSYSLALADAQSLTVDASTGGVFAAAERGAFTVYVKPKPKPTPKPASAGGGSAPGLPRYSGGGAPAEWMAQAGIAEADRSYVDYIVRRESGWNPNATNKRSGACGLVQALSCSKVPGNGYNPVDNLRWADGYAKGRYGSWEKAYQFWVRNHWW